MKKFNSDIEGATYKEYNANNRGTNAPDCVKRSLSMAFNMDYNQVSKLLIAKAKEKHRSCWNILPVYESVIYDLGGNKGEEPGEIIQVSEFIDKFVPDGVCIMETNKKPDGYGRGNHLTCSVNGTLYDSWDSSSQYVCQYYIIKNSNHEFTDIEDHLSELTPEGKTLIEQLCEKYKNKYNLPGQSELLWSGRKDNFSIRFTLRYSDKISFSSEFAERWTIDCVFNPTMTVEAARKKMIETIKIRMYDRYYAINQKYSGKAEGQTLFEESGYNDSQRSKLWLDNRERKFFDSLPGWIQPFIVYLKVDEPGQYSDSYQIEALPIKGDPDRKNVIFYGYNSADVKDEIARYKKNFERVDKDYSYYEEY